MSRPVQFDRDKLKAAVLHVVRTVGTERLSTVKLHKVLYLLDMLHFARTGRAVAGAEYRKRPFGPACVPLLTLLRDLEREGVLAVGETDYFGFSRRRYEAKGEPDAARLAADEIALLDEVADYVCNRNLVLPLGDYSLDEPWELTGWSEVIGYDTALLMFPTEVSPEAFELVGREAAALAEARSSGRAVGGALLSDFRSRILAAGGGARA